MITYPPYFDRRLAWFQNAWVYHNSYGIKRYSTRVRDHSEWILRDADGERLYLQYECNGRSCPRYAGDIGNPAFRADWIKRTRRRLEPGYRGVWIDDVNMTWRISNAGGERVIPIDPRTGNRMRLSSWRSYFAEFLAEVRRAFPDKEIAHNVIWYADREPADDPSIVRQIRAADYINLEFGVVDSGLSGGRGRFSLSAFLDFIDVVHDRGRAVVMMDGSRTRAEREYGLAGYLLTSTADDLYSSNNLKYTTPDHFWHGYRLNLGNSLGERYEWSDVMRRDFQCGMVLLNGPDASTRRIELDESLSSVFGRPISRVTLRERQAAILLDECACIGSTCTAR